MFSFKKGALALASVAVIAASISYGVGQKTKVIDLSEIVKDTKYADKAAKAEAIALVGERLTYSDAFPHAGKVFEKALKLDSGNSRARFYSAVLRIAALGEGGAVTLNPILAGFPLKLQNDAKDLVDQIPEGSAKKFLFSNKRGTMYSDKDVQRQTEILVSALGDLRYILETLKTRKPLELNVMTVYEAPGVGGVSGARIVRRCPVNVINEDVFQITQCDLQTRVSMKMDQNDLEAARLIVGGYMIYLAPALAYNPTGAIAVAQKMNGLRRQADLDLHEAIRTKSSLGVIEDRQIMKKLMLPIGAEAVEGYRLALANQQSVCASGNSGYGPNETVNRPGHMFKFGFCVNSENYYDTQRWVSALQWSSYQKFEGNDWTFENGLWTQIKRKAYVRMSLRPFVNGEMTDLKTYLPNGYDNCGNAISVPDNTLGGIFPDNNYVQAQRVIDTNYMKPRCGTTLSSNYGSPRVKSGSSSTARKSVSTSKSAGVTTTTTRYNLVK